jgi:phosphatidylserine decarboxylase
MNRALVKGLKIDLSDSEKQVEDFHSLEDLFTRALKPEARKILGEVCSPCDSLLRQSLPVDRGQLLQAKGLQYSVDDLLCLNENEKKEFNPAWYCSFYLAPHNYHRVHAPFKAQLSSARYVPGELWPVNDVFSKIVPRLFCRNERVVFELKHESGGTAYLVMVGALHVGRIQIKGVDTFVSNDFTRQLKPSKTRVFSFSPCREILPGDELGTFMLGSSVVLVFDKTLTDHFELKKVSKPVEVKLGDSLLVSKNEEIYGHSKTSN